VLIAMYLLQNFQEHNEILETGFGKSQEIKNVLFHTKKKQEIFQRRIKVFSGHKILEIGI
jgi:hypothetical protein